ncbi:hypothetical protein [Mycobacteroides chelonae]|uniref:hypothetical protein n=1 Tax=Mycobacteroides chelonae TaxID=1774 RepID=UPI0008A96D9D|nr:hypothetical protein [Mycobacteroides chelonae]OHU29040.1 hypothetical protein BKG78_23510 [Mycobacteroides chelonae]
MTFRVTYPVGSTFAKPNPQEGAEPFEDFTNEDAFIFMPGGVLGIWSEEDKRSYFLPPGKWAAVSGYEGHRPGAQKCVGEWRFAPALYDFPLS